MKEQRWIQGCGPQNLKRTESRRGQFMELVMQAKAGHEFYAPYIRSGKNFDSVIGHELRDFQLKRVVSLKSFYGCFRHFA